jgi:galactokinase
VAEARAVAPGRINLMGEHTDYHDGFVLPCAIPMRTEAVVRTRDDRRVRAWSRQIGPEPIEFEIGRERRGGAWGDYIQGVTWVLAREGMEPGGFDLHIDSSIPPGGGLGSSAALQVATLRALREAFELSLADVMLARLAQRAEVEFVGAPVGIMDQMASSLAREREALFLDTRTLEYERVPLPAGLALVVVDSGVRHQHAGGDYATRRRESEAAARLLGVERLRDAGPDALARLADLPPVAARRARHILTENARVLEARAALLEGDSPRLGRLFTESHVSMRDDYEISVAEVDQLVDTAIAQRGVLGARLTGGGFGGAVIVAAEAGALPLHFPACYDYFLLSAGRADEDHMRAAIELGRRGRRRGEVPVGAVVVLDGEVIGEGFNEPIGTNDPTAHAEIVALREAGKRIGNYRLTGATVYVTIEPCQMCVGAMIHARIARVVYGTREPKGGAIESTMRAHEQPMLNHRMEATAGVLEDECRELIQEFFRSRRESESRS